MGNILDLITWILENYEDRLREGHVYCIFNSHKIRYVKIKG